MDTLFLFARYLDEQGCYCLKINSDDELIAPPEQRTFSEIKTLQDDSRTLVVETTLHANILQLELTWLPERKARLAIPYALEEQVAEPIDTLHFAFDRHHYHNKHYTVAVLRRSRVEFIINLLKQHDIEFELITLDWFALSLGECCITDSYLLAYTEQFKGALSDELANTFKNAYPDCTALLFQDSNLPAYGTLPNSNESSYTWIAKKLLKTNPLNLCQGPLQQSTTADWIKKGYQLAGILCGVWLLSILIVKVIQLHDLNKKTSIIDEHIAVIYHQFFPEAKQVISPRFRINQLLGNDKNNSSSFWFLLNQLAIALKEIPMNVEQLRFQNRTLLVTLAAQDFDHLEQFENKLTQLHTKVKQTQAATHEKNVIATLELS